MLTEKQRRLLAQLEGGVPTAPRGVKGLTEQQRRLLAALDREAIHGGMNMEHDGTTMPCPQCGGAMQPIEAFVRAEFQGLERPGAKPQVCQTCGAPV